MRMKTYFENGSGIKESLLKLLVDIYPKVGEIITPEGENDGGEGIFTIYGQGSGFYYATLYAYDHPENPYYHSADALERCIRSWEYYYHHLTLEDGQTKIITMNQYWQLLFEEWNTLRWMCTIDLVGDALDPDLLSRWKERDYLSCEGIVADIREKYADMEFRKSLDFQTSNHFMWRLCAGYRYGLVKNDPAILADCDRMMDVICDAQPPCGSWREGGSMVNHYAHTSYGAIGLYVAYQRNTNPRFTEAARRCGRYLLQGYYDNNSPIDALDTRNRYDPGFMNPYTAPSLLDDPQINYFTSKQLQRLRGEEDHLAHDHHWLGFLLSGFEMMPEDPVMQLDERYAPHDPVYCFEGHPCAILRQKGWTVAMNCDTQHAHSQRFILERQNLFSVYHPTQTVIVGGGHSTSAPEFSCFNFIHDGTLTYLHERGELLAQGKGMRLLYGGAEMELVFEQITEGSVRVRYAVKSELMETDKVLVNVPLYIQNKRALKMNGKTLALPAMDHFWESGREMSLDGVALRFSREVELRLPVVAFNCYYQVQTKRPEDSFAIATATLDYQCTELTLEIALETAT